MAQHPRYLIGPFILDTPERRLTRNGDVVALTPKAFDTLVFLVERHGRLVEKAEFMTALWPDTFVEDVALARHISTIRKALGDVGDGNGFIETEPKSGYRFVGPVEVEERSANTPVAPVVRRSMIWLGAAAVAVLALVGWSRARPRPLDMTASETSNAEANREYLIGRHFWNRRTEDGFRKSIEHLERAVALDPRFATAHAALADAYLLLGDHGRQHETVPRARKAASTALAIDPKLGEAEASLALIAMNYDWDWAEADRRYRRAIELNPRYAVAHAWYGEYLAYMGRFDEGIAENARAQELDPLSLFTVSDAGKLYFLARRYDMALTMARKTLELDPGFIRGYFEMAGAQVMLGRYAEAIAALRDTHLPEDDDVVIQSRVVVDSFAGRTREARAGYDRLMTLASHRYMSPQRIARAAILVGEYDVAFAWLNRMCDERAPGPITLKVDLTFDPVRSDPRFDALMRRVGFVR